MKRFTSMKLLLAIMICISLISGCSSSKTVKTSTITVSAAASLSTFLDDIIAQFEADYKDVEVLVNYGSSGALQKQIEQGAPTDLFISAGVQQVERLTEKNLLVSEQITPLISNSLVVIEPHNDNNFETVYMHTLEDIFATKQPDFIALGETDTVPAGIYAKQALEHQAMWEEWKERFVFGKDVREVLAFVEQGNADFGIVYASDALSSQKVMVTYEIPDSWHDPILYVGAIVKASENQELAQQFLNYLISEQWLDTYEKSGFTKVE